MAKVQLEVEIDDEIIQSLGRAVVKKELEEFIDEEGREYLEELLEDDTTDDVLLDAPVVPTPVYSNGWGKLRQQKGETNGQRWGHQVFPV